MRAGGDARTIAPNCGEGGSGISDFSQIGYAALAGLVLGESVGIPLPGSTALVAAGILAAGGHLNIVVICVLSVGLTLVGANVAYAVGRVAGVRVFARPGPFLRHREVVLRRGTPFVERFGWLGAFASRFVPGLKECGALLVGALGMTWRRFVFWNTLGGLAWVLSHAVVAYYVGRALGTTGSVVAIGFIELAAVLLAAGVRHLRVRQARAATAAVPVAAVEQEIE